MGKIMTAKDVQLTVNILMEVWGLQMRPAAGVVVELKPHHLHRVLLLQALHLCRQQLVMIAAISDKKECNQTNGCSYHKKNKECVLAPSSEECSEFTKKRKCNRNACKFKNGSCVGRWE